MRMRATANAIPQALAIRLEPPGEEAVEVRLVEKLIRLPFLNDHRLRHQSPDLALLDRTEHSHRHSGGPRCCSCTRLSLR